MEVRKLNNSQQRGDVKMRIAVLSDIHGNYIALQECIDYALNRGIDTFILLGDYVGELAYPQKTMEILYSLKQKYNCFFIKGNKEDYWMNYNLRGYYQLRYVMDRHKE